MKLSIACITAAVLSMPLAITAAKPVTEDKGFWNCPLQSKCLEVTIEKMASVSTCLGGDCEYNICLTLALTKEECSKSGAISHTCLRTPDVCLGNPAIGGSCAFLGSSVQTPGPEDGHTQCQIVKGGDDAIFLLKDGAGCAGSDAASVDVAGIGFTASATGLCNPSARSADPACQNESSMVDSCTGNGEGKECIWTVTAPECGAADPCAGALSDALCCNGAIGCPGQCLNYVCPAPPEAEWECEKVCKQVIPDPHACSELPPPARRVLKKEDKAHSLLRA
jgi:hypothetical protein